MIEVRITTYKRPVMLERALRSLIDQTCAKWRAVVFDDSPSLEGRQVVAELGDSRIAYQANPANLGRIKNINFAFQEQSIFPEATHACVLEDDNWFDPELMAANLEALQKSQCFVLVRNYRMTDVHPDGSTTVNPSEPMRDMYGNEARLINIDERVHESFLTFSLGNLSYFWVLNKGIDLSMSSEIFHVHIAEIGRASSFTQACWYEPQPLATFSRFINKIQTPSGEAVASKNRRRLAKISEIEFTRLLIRMWTQELGINISVILRDANSRMEGKEAIQKLAEAGCLRAILQLSDMHSRLAFAKTQIVRLLFYRKWHTETLKVTLPRIGSRILQK